MMKYILILVGMSCWHTCFSQKYDIKWLSGLLGFEQYLIDFSNISPSVEKLDNNNFVVTLTNLTMSDIRGENTFFSNGCSIRPINTPAPISLINQGDYFCKLLLPVNAPHEIFALPIPDAEDKFIIFNYEITLPVGQPSSTYNCFHKKALYHTVAINSDHSIEVTSSDQILSQGCLQKAAACKHANGRDWWIILGDNLEPRFFRWLLSQNGLEVRDTQWIANPTIDSNPAGGFAPNDAMLFSPDGSKLLLNTIRGGLVLYNFDRCSGLISNPINFFDKDDYTLPAIFSPNSRYIYCADNKNSSIYQFDTYASDISTSKIEVGVWDGFSDPVHIYETKFGEMVNGYDGRTYIVAGGAYIHTIEYPNRAGLDCKVVQRAYETPSPTTFSIYYPNYRLGPIDGTTCDSLGIDNRPLAIFRYAVDDTLSPLVVNFTDASTYEPTQWQWNFGDGGTSSLTDPVHAFSAPGTYTVCLVVSNAFASDTLCREVQVGTSGVTNMPVLPLVKVAPNPVVTMLHVALPAQIHGIMPRFRLTDVWGRLYREVSLRDFDTAVDMSSAAPGVYLWQVLWGTGVTQSGRVVKVE
jgi:PKD repeat protein